MDGISDSKDMNLGKFLEMVRDKEAWHAQSIGSERDDLATEKLQQIRTYHIALGTLLILCNSLYGKSL